MKVHRIDTGVSFYEAERGLLFRTINDENELVKITDTLYCTLTDLEGAIHDVKQQEKITELSLFTFIHTLSTYFTVAEEGLRIIPLAHIDFDYKIPISTKPYDNPVVKTLQDFPA